jgi:hypothetical protein
MRAGRLRLLTKRRLTLALVVLVAVLVPLAAVGATNDWWFLHDHAPKPVSDPLVVKEGEWSGHTWQLIAYRSTTHGLCISVTPARSGTTGSGAAMSCGPFVGVPRTAETKLSTEMMITFLLSAGADEEFPAYIAGPVVDTASTVEIHFGTGDVLRLPTFSGAESLGRIRFYATQLPATIRMPPPDLGFEGQRTFIDSLAGLDKDGKVVACLVPRTAVNGVSPLSDCR